MSKLGQGSGERVLWMGWGWCLWQRPARRKDEGEGRGCYGCGGGAGWRWARAAAESP